MGGRRSYLHPHNEIICEDEKTMHLRVVHDARARCSGITFNYCLRIGPLLLPKIIYIMLHFHLKLVTLVSDLEKAFLMVEVDERHWDFLHLLWISCIVYGSLIFVVICQRSSDCHEAFLPVSIWTKPESVFIEHHFESSFEEI